MQSCFAATNADFFRDVMAEFVKAGGRVLDANAGPRRIWAKLTNQTTLQSNPESASIAPLLYDVVWLDIRASAGLTLRADDRALPFSNGVFDAIVFDPPYAPGGVPPMAFTRSVDPKRRLSYYSTKWDEAEITSMYDYKGLKRLVTDVRLEFWRVLRSRGVLIMKSAEFRDGRETFPMTAYTWTKWKELFALEAWLVQMIPPAGRGQRYIHTKVTNSHNTWSVWRHKRS